MVFQGLFALRIELILVSHHTLHHFPIYDRGSPWLKHSGLICYLNTHLWIGEMMLSSFGP